MKQRTREISGYFADNYQNYNVRLIIAVVVERLNTTAESKKSACLPAWGPVCQSSVLSALISSFLVELKPS